MEEVVVVDKEGLKREDVDIAKRGDMTRLLGSCPPCRLVPGMFSRNHYPFTNVIILSYHGNK